MRALGPHALVAERHIGLGIAKEEIVRQALPLPRRDMLCESLEEKIVCWADLFFSKTPERLWQEKSLTEIEQRAAHYGQRQIALFRNGAAYLNEIRYLLNCLNPSNTSRIW